MFINHESLDPRELSLRLILLRVLFVVARTEKSEERGMKDERQPLNGNVFKLVVRTHGAAECHCTRLLYHCPLLFGDLGVIHVQVFQV